MLGTKVTRMNMITMVLDLKILKSSEKHGFLISIIIWCRQYPDASKSSVCFWSSQEGHQIQTSSDKSSEAEQNIRDRRAL